MGQEDQSREGRLILVPHTHVSCLVHLVFSTSRTTTYNPGTDAGSTACLSGRDRARERDGGDRGRRRSGSRSFAAFFAEYRTHRQGGSIVEIGLLEVDPREFPAITRVFLGSRDMGPFRSAFPKRRRRWLTFMLRPSITNGLARQRNSENF